MVSTNYDAEQIAKEIAEMMSSLETIKNNEDLPKRCVDPVMKYCQECPYGSVSYGDDVESYSDIAGSYFETHCSLGYNQGRPEDVQGWRRLNGGRKRMLRGRKSNGRNDRNKQED